MQEHCATAKPRGRSETIFTGGENDAHAECSLLETPHQDTQGQTFTHIAVTKLSCLSCWLLFEAYRQYSNVSSSFVGAIPILAAPGPCRILATRSYTAFAGAIS